MRSTEDLRRTLERIDGRGYKAYRDAEGAYDMGRFTLLLDRAQGDPFASPSRLRVRLARAEAGFEAELSGNRSREVALRDYLTRAFGTACGRIARGRRGTGHSGRISIARAGQEILERSAVTLDPAWLEARFVMGLPAHGRRVAGREAAEMLLDELPRIVEASLVRASLEGVALRAHVEANEDADALRALLPAEGLVAFVADEAVLPRRSGVDPRPMDRGRIVPFRAPDSLRVRLRLPNAGEVTGLGLRQGVTLIVGGGYHGKSTLLRALELGVYNHLPGDGRERVITEPTAVKIRSEDGRRVEQVDISPFISNLPFGRETRAFSTEDASGSTSQAANIIEALEAGSRLLLIDEDTSATNFMIRDHRMQELVAKEKEPITPFIDRVRQLYEERGVSTVLVVGGSGDYFDVADAVLCMVEYAPRDVTAEAREIAERHRAERRREGGDRFGRPRVRIPQRQSFDPSKGRRAEKVTSRGVGSIQFGAGEIDLGRVEQLVDPAQTRAVGDAILLAMERMDGRRTLARIVGEVTDELERRGLDALAGQPHGDHAAFRGQELACAINRLRSLRVRQAEEP